MRTLFYRLPRLSVLTILFVLIGGVLAVNSLGRQEDPVLIERYGFVLVALPGADAERVEALITEPIEAALMELPELKEVTSVSRSGFSQVGIDIREDLTATEVDNAWTLIRQQVDKARASFPAGTTTPEINRQYLGAATLIVGVEWAGEGEPSLAVMRRTALNLEDKFQRLPDTEQTEVFGLPAEEVRVIADPEALAAAGLSMRDAAGLIASADSKTPAGRLRARHRAPGWRIPARLRPAPGRRCGLRSRPRHQWSAAPRYCRRVPCRR